MTNIKSVLNWLGSRLGERSSWLGLTAILTSVGLSVSPELQDVIIQLGVSAAGLIAFLTCDKIVVAAKK